MNYWSSARRSRHWVRDWPSTRRRGTSTRNDADETAAVIADILEWRRGQDDALLEAKRRVEVLQRSEGDLSTAWKDAMTSPFWAGEQKITSEQNLSVLGDAAQRRAQICAQQALHQSPCEETLLALDDARGHLERRTAAWRSTAQRRGVDAPAAGAGPRLLHRAQD